ncbi:rCG25817 [Rattus norvegicus]|uniref:RCG25817 n=1 Tax=Rattus norvegicus TaxID=10116 RepID=A6I3L5_RAT|nr:rCG25817 [Rattus norvegicus]
MISNCLSEGRLCSSGRELAARQAGLCFRSCLQVPALTSCADGFIKHKMKCHPSLTPP